MAEAAVAFSVLKQFGTNIANSFKADDASSWQKTTTNVLVKLKDVALYPVVAGLDYFNNPKTGWTKLAEKDSDLTIAELTQFKLFVASAHKFREGLEHYTATGEPYEGTLYPFNAWEFIHFGSIGITKGTILKYNRLALLCVDLAAGNLASGKSLTKQADIAFLSNTYVKTIYTQARTEQQAKIASLATPEQVRFLEREVQTPNVYDTFMIQSFVPHVARPLVFTRDLNEYNSAQTLCEITEKVANDLVLLSGVDGTYGQQTFSKYLTLQAVAGVFFDDYVVELLRPSVLDTLIKVMDNAPEMVPVQLNAQNWMIGKRYPYYFSKQVVSISHNHSVQLAMLSPFADLQNVLISKTPIIKALVSQGFSIEEEMASKQTIVDVSKSFHEQQSHSEAVAEMLDEEARVLKKLKEQKDDLENELVLSKLGLVTRAPWAVFTAIIAILIVYRSGDPSVALFAGFIYVSTNADIFFPSDAAKLSVLDEINEEISTTKDRIDVIAKKFID